MGNLDIYCYHSDGGNDFLRGSFEKGYDISRCIHYNVPEGEMSESRVCV